MRSLARAIVICKQYSEYYARIVLAEHEDFMHEPNSITYMDVYTQDKIQLTFLTKLNVAVNECNHTDIL